jgi:MSHA pilin protein MshD
MPINTPAKYRLKNQRGLSLIELIVFIIVISVASTALFQVYTYSQIMSVDPLIRVRALELAQARLDEILALKYDASTPSGGIPACGLTAGIPCNSDAGDTDMNDVDDFNNVNDAPFVGYARSVTVTSNGNEKLITVTVAAPINVRITLAAYRANF